MKEMTSPSLLANSGSFAFALCVYVCAFICSFVRVCVCVCAPLETSIVHILSTQKHQTMLFRLLLSALVPSYTFCRQMGKVDSDPVENGETSLVKRDDGMVVAHIHTGITLSEGACHLVSFA